jgi:predicted amidohydrolase
MPRIAAVHKPPALLDRERTLAVVATSVAEAAAGGAKLVVD